jgi:two-component system, chemotaxis family, CheB/CheR fusion protein
MSQDFTLERLLDEIASQRNVDLRGYKRSTLERRFRKRMFEVKCADYGDYAAFLRAHPAEVNQLLNTVLINVTEFFRDPQAWEVLRSEVLPQLLEGKKPGDPVRCWSAGCATGEEPYSIAILLAEHFGAHLPEYDVKIYGTDIDEDALNAARRAEYSRDRLRHLRPDWLKKYFQGEKTPRVNRNLRRLCIFGRSNLLSDPPISHVELLACRNLLIYLDSATQAQALKRLHYALEPQGVLFIGKATSLMGAERLFRLLNSKFRLFQRAETPGADELDMAALAGTGRRTREDADFLRLEHATLLETLEPGVLVLDGQDTVLTENASATRLWGIQKDLIGKTITRSELARACPDLAFQLQQAHERNEVISFHCPAGTRNKPTTLSVTLKPVVTQDGGRVGTLEYGVATAVGQRSAGNHQRGAAIGQRRAGNHERGAAVYQRRAGDHQRRAAVIE